MGAKLPQLDVLYQAGINPKTGLPLKMGGSKCVLKEDIKKFLRLVDEQDAVNRYVWYNLPANITSQELERMLYYKGQLCLFYDKDLEEFYFMPYALELTPDDVLNSTVLLHDYTKQLSQTILPRVSVNDPILDVMSECIPMMRTNMLLSTGINGIRVQDADQQQNIEDASRSLEISALTGKPWMPIIGTVEFQELTNNLSGKAEDYMLTMQSLDNLRLSGYGIDNGGLFEKKAHELQTEADINGGPVGLVLQDGLSIRQNFCNIVNSIWDLGIWCEPAQNIMGMDTDGDGAIYDDNSDGANTGIETEGGQENE